MDCEIMADNIDKTSMKARILPPPAAETPAIVSGIGTSEAWTDFPASNMFGQENRRGCRMKVMAWRTLTMASLFLAGLQTSTSAEEAASCLTPGRSLAVVRATHSLPLYPTTSQRLGEQGGVVVTVSVGADGVPTDATIAQSSGSQRLDDATVTHIKAHWRWEPPLEDCKPASVQTSVIAVWHLGRPPKADMGWVMPDADYPPGAAEQGEAGDTYLELSLGEGSTIKDVRVLYSSGFPDLDDKALAVLKIASDAMAGKPAGTQIVLARWKLPSEQIKKYLEIMEIYAQRI